MDAINHLRMTLPITDSILRGELRPNILKQSLDQKELLIRNARKISQKSQLLELEFAINDVLSGLVNTKDIYEEDKKTRDAAIHVRVNKIIQNEPRFRYIDSEVIIDNVLPLPELKSPLLRFYNTILDAEVLRTRLSMIYLCRAIQDDAFIRSTLKALFRKINFICREALQWEEHKDVMLLIPIKLTHLYFTLLNTYGEVLASYEAAEYEDDFMDFVYGWKGEYPTSNEETTYLKQSGIRAAIVNTLVDMPDTPQTKDSVVSIEKERPKDKADIFLDGVTEYNFLEIPKIKQLGTIEKVHSLVMTMLENPGHACAMLEHLEFYKWIKEKQRVNFTLYKYDSLCSKVVMGKESDSAFHTVRMSLNKNNKNAEKYRAYAYIDQVVNEYITLLNS